MLPIRSCATLAAVLLTLTGASAGAETLQDALSLAYTTNPTLQAERARIRALDENFVQARAVALPSLTASAQATDSSTESAGVNPNTGIPLGGLRTSDTTAYSLTATQNLYRGGRTRAVMDQARSGIEAGRAQLWSLQQSILVETVAAYMDVRRDEAIVSIRANNVGVLERQLQASRDRFEVGEITRTDVSQAQARLAGARSLFAAAQATRVVNRAAYERIVGRAPGSLEEQPALPPLPDTLQVAFEIAAAANPDVEAARHAEDAAHAAVRDAKGAMRPSANLTATASHTETYSGSPFESDGLSLVGRISVPLYAGGANSSVLRQARQNESRARLQLRDAERRVREAVASAWSGYQAAQSQIVSTSEQVRANEIAFEGVEAEAGVGLRTTLDVLNAEQELLNARLAFASAEREAYVAGYRVLQSVGAVGPETLGLEVDGYDPAVNFSSVRRRYLGIGVFE